MKRISFIFLLSSLLLTGCKPKPDTRTDQPIVTVSILPFKYFVEQLAGEKFRVNVLVPPGADHHSYEPAPRQLQEMEESSVLFINGHLGFEEAWMPGIRSNNPDLKIVDLSEGINLIIIEDAEAEHDDHEVEKSDHGHSHEGPDPHYWLSVKEAKLIAEKMARGLQAADPSCENLVTGNLRKLEQRLDSLDNQFKITLEPLKHRSFIIFHPALNYIARDYNLIQHAMEEGGKEPAASHFKELVDLSSAEQINTIFIQKEYDQENAETLAREINARVVIIDPMSDDWINELQRIVRELAAMDIVK
ncbi:MAG TPA: hypothetical protein DC042_08800 [Bacteroidales bacterium]|nr:hypothetical protein [Bacteroidales bacterium]